MQKLDPDFLSALKGAFNSAIFHLEHLDESSVAATLSVAELRAQLDRPLADPIQPLLALGKPVRTRYQWPKTRRSRSAAIIV